MIETSPIYRRYGPGCLVDKDTALFDLTGHADVTGTITGTFRNPNIQVKAKAEKTGYSFMQFGTVTGDFKIQDGNLSFVGGTPADTPHQASVQVQTQNLFKPSRSTKLSTKFSDIEASELLENPEIKGKIDGTSKLRRSALPDSQARAKSKY